MKKKRLSQYHTIALFAGFCCMGYVASLFLTYSFIVMPGLATIGDSAFVEAFQGLETRFQNAENSAPKHSLGYGNVPAMIAFPGALLFSLLAIALGWKKSYTRWVLVAIVLFTLGMITTVLYNLPSNVAIFAAGDPNLIDVGQVRQEFNEKAWLFWNNFRATTTTMATFFLAWALYLKIRSTAYRP